MVVTPEREPQTPPAPESVVKQPETFVVPERIQDVAQATPQTQVTAQVTDDAGQKLIQTPATQQVTIQVPADPVQLDDWSKGSPFDTLTWFATFWLRMIKKAAHFGWRVVTGKGKIKQ
jgi:hypothetical protein